MKKLIFLTLFCISMLPITAQEKVLPDEIDLLYGRATMIDTVDQAYTKQAYTAGDLMVQSGTYQLTGIVLSMAGSMVILTGDTNDDTYKNRVVGGSILGVAGLICSVIGHNKLIKAGKVMNGDLIISLNSSREGIGLAFNF